MASPTDLTPTVGREEVGSLSGKASQEDSWTGLRRKRAVAHGTGLVAEEEEPALRMPGAKAKKKEKVVKRKTRHHPTGTSSRARQGAKPFALLLEEVHSSRHHSFRTPLSFWWLSGDREAPLSSRRLCRAGGCGSRGPPHVRDGGGASVRATAARLLQRVRLHQRVLVRAMRRALLQSPLPRRARRHALHEVHYLIVARPL